MGKLREILKKRKGKSSLSLFEGLAKDLSELMSPTTSKKELRKILEKRKK